MPPLVAVIISNLPAIIKSGQTVVEFVRRERAAMVQKQEWTEADERAFADLLAAAGRSAAWQQDGQ